MKRTIVITIIICLFTATPRTSEAGDNNSDDDFVIETFYSNSETDLLALTSPTGGLFAPSPEGIPTLDDPILQDALAVLVLVTDSSGEIVGFASELEELDFGADGYFSDTSWTLKMPQRGALFLTQTEQFDILMAEIADMMATGEYERAFDPPLTFVTTVPGTGKIIGGTGEFKKAIGELRETNKFYFISLITGVNQVEIILDVTFFNHHGHGHDGRHHGHGHDHE